MRNERVKLRNRLRTENAFIPTSHEFNCTSLRSLINSWIMNHGRDFPDEVIGVSGTCDILPLLHRIFMGNNDAMIQSIEQTQLPFVELVESLVAAANLTFLSTHKSFIADQKGKKDLHLSELFGHKSISCDNSIGEVNTLSALATSIDVLNNILIIVGEIANLLPTTAKISNEESIKAINSLLFQGMCHFGFKSSYDSAIWNDGNFYEVNNAKYVVRFTDKKRLKLEEIGRFRIQQDSFSELAKSNVNEEYTPNRRIKPGICLKQATVVNGTVKYVLGAGIDKIERQAELRDLITIKTFYGFLEKTTLPSCGTLTVLDLIFLLNVIKSLYVKVSESLTHCEGYQTIEEIRTYSFRIEKQELVKYLLERTTYTISEIEFFINLLTNRKTERVNFWNYPFYQVGNQLVVSLMSLTSPMIFNLIDHWLEQAGSSLDKRGAELEKYVCDELEKEFSLKGYFCQIPRRKKFKSSTKAKEEIDLIVNLKDIVIVAEVKCIRYPMEIRDYYNCYERLSKGSLQVIRKTDYLKQFGYEFESDIGKIVGKSIIRLVITNYPIFSGCQINDVPVVDFRWLSNFVKYQQLINYSVHQSYGRNITQVKNAVDLYSNESEFCQVFDQQMRQPAIIESFMDKVKLKDSKMTAENPMFEIYIETAIFNNLP